PQLATAMATNAQIPTMANSRIFRVQVITTFMIPAIIIMITVQVTSLMSNVFHPVLVRKAAIFAIKATVIHPAYKQNGHQTNAITGSGAFQRSMLVLITIFNNENSNTIITKTDNAVSPDTQVINHKQLQIHVI